MRIVRIFLITLCVVLIVIGCSKKKETNQTSNEIIQPSPPRDINSVETKETPSASNPTEKPKITFIELGSVNCIPCRMMQPVMEKIEEKYKGQVKVIFYDVWTESGKPYGIKYNIRVIPTQIFLEENGKEFFRHEGYFPFKEIENIFAQKGLHQD